MTMSNAVPYLFFPGTCREAFAFYEKTLNGKMLAMMAASEAPPTDQNMMGDPNLIMHACLDLPGGGRLMASDSPAQYYQKPQGFSVSIHPTSAKEAERLFAVLSEGGQVTMPMEKTFWAERFGCCVDRFGTPWMINCEKDA